MLTTERTGQYCSAVDGFICRPRESSSSVNVCVPLFADGSDCYRGYECASHDCLPPPSGSGLPTGTCATRPDPRDLPDGASCMDDKSCKSGHCTNGQCQSVAQYGDYHSFCSWQPMGGAAMVGLVGSEAPRTTSPRADGRSTRAARRARGCHVLGQRCGCHSPWCQS